MYTVYVLYSEKYDKIYIGFTSDLTQRMISHNQLAKKGFTRKYRPWIVIHTESFDEKDQAIKREKMLKGGQGRFWIKNTLIPDFRNKS